MSVLQHERLIRNGRLLMRQAGREAILLSFVDDSWTIEVVGSGPHQFDEQGKAQSSPPQRTPWPLTCRVVEESEAELFGQQRAMAKVQCKGKVSEDEWAVHMTFAEGLGMIEQIQSSRRGGQSAPGELATRLVEIKPGVDGE